MADATERDLDAAERALGTLPKTGEGPEDVRRREAWERRLAPLLDVIAPAEPPPDLFARVEARLDRDAFNDDLAAERARTGRWRGATVLAGALAAVLALWIVVPGVLVAPQEAPRYVAVVTSDTDGSTGLVIEFDTATGVATVIPAGASAPENRALEMWHLPDGETRPRSLGLLPQGPEARVTFAAGPGDLFALSFEPPGGSPTGQPTQPAYHGSIVRVD